MKLITTRLLIPFLLALTAAEADVKRELNAN